MLKPLIYPKGGIHSKLRVAKDICFITLGFPFTIHKLCTYVKPGTTKLIVHRNGTLRVLTPGLHILLLNGTQVHTLTKHPTHFNIVLKEVPILGRKFNIHCELSVEGAKGDLPVTFTLIPINNLYANIQAILLQVLLEQIYPPDCNIPDITTEYLHKLHQYSQAHNVSWTVNRLELTTTYNSCRSYG